MARDRNQRGITPLALPSVEKLRAKLAWEFRMDRYLNAGVMFVRDTPAAHAFYAEWHRRWKRALSLGMWQDQFSFNSVIATGTATIAILPDRDNWVTHSTVMLRGRLLHESRDLTGVGALGAIRHLAYSLRGPCGDGLMVRPVTVTGSRRWST